MKINFASQVKTAPIHLPLIITMMEREKLFLNYPGSATIHPCALSNPRLWAARAAAAIVLTLFGAREQSSRIGPEKH